MLSLCGIVEYAVVIVTRVIGPGLMTLGGLVRELPGTLSKYASQTTGNVVVYALGLSVTSLILTNYEQSTAP